MVEGSLLVTYFLQSTASVESDGARKASSATFFQHMRACLNPDGVKNLVLAHFSSAQRFTSNAME
jgi:hypothetical protein